MGINDNIDRRTFVRNTGIALGALATPWGVALAGEKALPKDVLFRFLFCNDTHVVKEADAKHFGKFIDDANKASDLFDFLIVCGDLGNKGTEEELALSKRELDRLKKPFYTVVGNHDVLKNKDKTPYRKVFGNDRENYLIQHKGIGMIYLDLSDGHKSKVTVPKSAVDWLNTTLAELDKNLPLLVFTHFPLHEGAPMYTAKGADELFNLLDSRTVLGYFNGHWHGRWKGERNGVDFYCNACMSNSRNNFKWGPPWYKEKHQDMTEGFLLIDVLKTGVRTSFLEYGKVPAV